MKWGIMAQRSHRGRKTGQLITPEAAASYGVDQVLVSGGVSLPVPAESLWALLSRPEDIASWMSELHTWACPAPDRFGAGDELAAQVQMFHMLHDVRLVVTEFRPARSWTMTCATVSGIAVTFTVELEHLPEISRATLRTGLHGRVLRDTDAGVLRHAIQTALDASVQRLAEIADPDRITTRLPVAAAPRPTRERAPGFE
ncbi:SRPBCC family protein [Nocardia sp. NPDC058633]|uniref:SRPBCC family protein n=1 Tax=Nocardia sp. NPDC058633 TaxID=3346568 RepID=UPI00365F014F